ncbi:hypothetical protein BGZ70_003047 [Mortierella alpina]|uniref:Uncharacterized protein n=1 Tax=Mortierella alpina TaxID=64518 RepID=A0A9P6M557_MORAP|nr:hypothetical protein BGZ70_003047 [Mortierella alpina]
MFKSSILLGLAFALGAVGAVGAVGNQGNKTLNGKKGGRTAMTLYTAWYLEGVPSYCFDYEFDQCYYLSDTIVSGGLSSAKFKNFDFYLRRFSVTFYSGRYCNDYYDRWSFTLISDYKDPEYNINQFPTLNDQVRSFKVANFHTSTESGNIGSNPEDAKLSGCFQH